MFNTFRFLKNNLNRDIIVYFLGERPFMCDICGSRFATKGGLRSHSNVHTGVKRKMKVQMKHPCSVCNKRFMTHDLVRHMRIHTGIQHIVSPIERCNGDYSMLQLYSMLITFIIRSVGGHFGIPYNCIRQKLYKNRIWIDINRLVSAIPLIV